MTTINGAMQLYRTASAGNRKKDDIYIEISPADTGITLNLQSTVFALYGKQISAQIKDRLAEFGISSANITAEDFGALDFVIDARLETAVFRASRRTQP